MTLSSNNSYLMIPPMFVESSPSYESLNDALNTGNHYDPAEVNESTTYIKSEFSYYNNSSNNNNCSLANQKPQLLVDTTTDDNCCSISLPSLTSSGQSSPQQSVPTILYPFAEFRNSSNHHDDNNNNGNNGNTIHVKTEEFPLDQLTLDSVSSCESSPINRPGSNGNNNVTNQNNNSSTLESHHQEQVRFIIYEPEGHNNHHHNNGNCASANGGQSSISLTFDYLPTQQHQQNHTLPSDSPNYATSTTSSSPSLSYTHLRSHSPARPYPCPMCPRSFSRKHDLQRHIRVHTGVKPYQCPCCRKAFARTDALRRHFKVEVTCGQSEAVQNMKTRRRYSEMQ
ncbi:4739_t:CDS:2 [Ambispora gerdemannii]|uniref:4739_t:CDS:1 n=1 Tax=Ambispora gerdemannii TaxID=144530 RepID=A0A9N8V1V4_9GLOM|nr:4739_t:CDS:2 [Ambispora gerdemannii]